MKTSTLALTKLRRVLACNDDAEEIKTKVK